MPSHAEQSGEPYLTADADALLRTVVAPAPDEPHAAGKNILYCGTIQLAWNELLRLCGGPPDLGGPCEIAERLSREASRFTRDDLDDDSYVARAGEGDAVLSEIRRELARKFQGAASPGMLPERLPGDALFVYAYLFKSLAFATPLLREEGGGLEFNGSRSVRHFGLWETADEADWKQQARQVVVHDHRSDEDFVVELLTRARDDRLIVARVPPGATLLATTREVLARATPSAWSRMMGGAHLRRKDTLKIPIVDFDVLCHFSELAGRRLASRQRIISQADQSIRFRLDDKGALLKSEFALTAPRGGIRLGFLPRNFICDGPFLVLLLRRGRAAPYLSLWIEDTELLIPARDAPLPAPPLMAL
ncbi:uncharacterized protein SOCEGT47_031630 [Sorangium cellulosum]|uniref:Uncharacterized protein n=1 Tax=Sorangium cellulosum TaxID=56 RepID=A0A4P2Q0F7_SORCE|nr:hypothetical protein [Sorangium cellulosum]AUX22659.1 uncharacterized protein SOCEGT47_031630 [Sorangium cellulosum]